MGLIPAPRFPRVFERAAICARQLWGYMAENTAPSEREVTEHIAASIGTLKADVIKLLDEERERERFSGRYFILGRLKKQIEELL